MNSSRIALKIAFVFATCCHRVYGHITRKWSQYGSETVFSNFPISLSF